MTLAQQEPPQADTGGHVATWSLRGGDREEVGQGRHQNGECRITAPTEAHPKLQPDRDPHSGWGGLSWGCG